MKRWLIYIVGIAALAVLPAGQGTDVGELEPVEVLYIYNEEGWIAAATDSGDYGRGITLESALEDMKETAKGEIFLETVAYVLVTEETQALMKGLGEILRPGTAVVLATGEVDVKQIAEFLHIHEPEVQLRMCVTGQVELPKLMTAGERYYLVQSGAF